MKFGQHQYSGFFGTFLFNSYRELLKHNNFCVQRNSPCFEEESCESSSGSASLISIFDYLTKVSFRILRVSIAFQRNPTFLNPVYDPKKKGRLISPKKMWELQIWREVYCCTDVEQIVNSPVSLKYVEKRLVSNI